MIPFLLKNRFWAILFNLSFICLFSTSSFGQSQYLRDYVILAGNSNCSSGCGVDIGTQVEIDSGIIAGYNDLNISNQFSHGGSMYGGQSMNFGTGANVSGNIWIYNSQSSTNNILVSGNNTNFNDIYANGDVSIQAGIVNGSVTHPTGTVYNGPTPIGGEIFANPSINGLPAFPKVHNFPSSGSGKLQSTQSIVPGSYGDVELKNGKTLTFSGTGDYIFNSIDNSGSTNNFVFDFQNEATGSIRIFIHGNVDLGKLNVSIINGGSASRVFAETHGNGSGNNDVAWTMDGSASGSAQSTSWQGTVWAPYGSIELAGGSNGPYILGSFFTQKNISIENQTRIIHAPYDYCDWMTVSASITAPDDTLNCNNASVTIEGLSNYATASPTWTTTNGNIVSGGQSFTVTVDAPGIYRLTVTDSIGCPKSIDIEVYKVDCIVPYYPPPTNGKTYDLIGSELTSLHENNGYIDSLQYIFNLSQDSVYIEVIALKSQYQSLLTLLQTTPYGLTKIVNNGPNSLIITGLYPIANLPKLDSLPTLIKYVRPLFPPILSSVANTQGDISMRSNIARNGFSVGGENVKIGVLSDSYNTQPGNPAQLDITNEDLPGTGNPNNSNPVNVLSEYPYGTGSDEGRAMLQIIHDVAPKADLTFRSGFVSAGDMAQGIYELYADSCDIIVDDITYITEPFLYDGVVAKAVDSVTSLGVSYFCSAGNFGDKSYSSSFNGVAAPAGITGYAHDFGGGDVFQNVLLPKGVYTIVLQWQDSIYSIGQTTGASADLDIYLTDDQGNTLFGFNRVNTSGDPLEILPFTVTDNTVSNILITQSNGNANVNFKYIVFRGNMVINEYNSGNSTIVGQANSEGAMAVGAVFYEFTPEFNVSPPTIASFSSKGGTPVNGVVRNKPEIIAPNGVNTSVYLGGPDYESDNVPNFFGTSAAAPHAAAVAALIKSAKLKYDSVDVSPADIKSIITSTAIDMGTSGFDYNTGNGFIQADQALLTFANPLPSISEITLVDTTQSAGSQTVNVYVKGSHFTNSTLIILRDDTLSSTFINSNKIEAVVPAFSGNPPVRAFNNSITTYQLDGGYSDTLLFFSTPKKHIQIIVDNKTKRYSEAIPALTFHVLVDSALLDTSGFTIQDLGLDSVEVTTAATSQSEIGNYLLRAEMPALDLSDPIDLGLSELYDYEFIDGVLTIEQMPLVIKAKDTTVVYGALLGNFKFSYEVIDSLIDPADTLVFANALRVEHESKLSKGLALVNGEKVVGGRALVNADVEKLTFMASGRALVNGRTISKGYALVNGVPTEDSTYVVDIDVESIYGYQDNPENTTTIKAYSTVSGRALVNALSLSKGYALVNGFSIAKGYALVNGMKFSDAKGYALVNGEPTNTDSSDVVMIMDEADTDTTNNDTTAEFYSINLITGNTVGDHAIVPGAFVNRNYSITYEIGTLTIDPAPLTVSGPDSIYSYYGDTINIEVLLTGLQYDDTDTAIVSSGPTITIYDANNNVYNQTIVEPGSYFIAPSNLVLSPENYDVIYDSTKLFVEVQTITWTGAISGDWNDPLNWSPNQVPTKYNNVVFDGSAINPPIINSNISLYGIEIQAGSTVVVGSGAVLNIENSFNNSGTFILQPGASLTFGQP